MEDGRIKGNVSIDVDSQGNLWLSNKQIVISDEAGDVICLVQYDPDGDECVEYQRLAEELVARLNASQALAALLRRLTASDGGPAADPGGLHDEALALLARLGGAQ